MTFIDLYDTVAVTREQHAMLTKAHASQILTDRELAVLDLAAHGLETTEIAAQLEITHGTARNYLSSAFTKLGAKNRTEAIFKARELGILT